MHILISLVILSISVTLISYTTFGSNPITTLRLYFNTKKTMEGLVKIGITVKPKDFLIWEKSNFGDYKTEWKFIDYHNRSWSKATVYFNLKGQITYISGDKYDRDLDTMEHYCKESIDFKSFTKIKINK